MKASRTYEQLLHDIANGDEEETPSTYTPLSHHIRDEKLARNAYLVKRGKESKCDECGINWAMPPEGVLDNSNSRKEKLCWTCHKKGMAPPPPAPPIPPPTKNIWKYVNEHYPEWVLAKAEQNKGEQIVALAKALKAREPLDVIEYIANRLPKGFPMQRNGDGLLPLHIALNARCEEPVIQFILSAYPEAAKDVAIDNTLPALHALRIGGIRIGIVRTLVNAATRNLVRSELTKLDREGKNFLQQFVTYQHAGRSQVELLVGLGGRELLRATDVQGRIAIHHACSGGQLVVIETLIRCDPEGLLVEDGRNGWVPLQFFICNSSKYEFLARECAFQALTELKKYATATTGHIDKRGRSSMHLAVESTAPADVIDGLMDFMPDFMLQDHNRRSVLHLALDRPKVGAEFTERLIRRCPRAASLQTEHGFTPLRTLLHYEPGESELDWSENERFTLMCRLLKADNGAGASVQDSFDQNAIPLHYVLKHPQKFPIRHALHLVKYGGLEIPDNFGDLALHVAVKMRADLKIIAEILDSHVEAAQTKSHLGLTPAQAGLRTNAGRKIIRLLLSAYMGDRDVVMTATREDVDWSLKRMVDMYPERSAVTDANGNTPLHWAIERHADESVIREMLQSHPSLNRKVGDRMLPPLHLCCFLPYSSYTLKHLRVLHACDRTQIKVDIGSRMPLHFASMSDQPVEVIDFLIDTFKWPVQIRDDSGRVPAYYAMKNKNAQVLNLLLSVYCGPDDLIKEVPLESLRYAAKFPCPFENDAVKQSIFHRLCFNDKHAHVMRLLAHYRPKLVLERDNEDRTPLDVCDDNDSVMTKNAIIEELERHNIRSADGKSLFKRISKDDRAVPKSTKLQLPIGKLKKEAHVLCFETLARTLVQQNSHLGATLDILNLRPSTKIVGAILKIMRLGGILPDSCPGLPLIIPTKFASYRTSKECLTAGIGFLQDGLKKIGPQGHFRVYFLCEDAFLNPEHCGQCSYHPYSSHHHPVEIIRPGGKILDIAPVQVMMVNLLRLGMDEWRESLPYHFEELQGSLVDNLLMDYMEEFFMNVSVRTSDNDLEDTFERIFQSKNLSNSYRSIRDLVFKYQTSPALIAVEDLEEDAMADGLENPSIYVCEMHSISARYEVVYAPSVQSEENNDDELSHGSSFAGDDQHLFMEPAKRYTTSKSPFSTFCIVQ
jgi:ankyrin repeat protein